MQWNSPEWKKLGKLAVILAGVYLIFRFLLPWLFPFLAAWLIVVLVRKWERVAGKHLNLKKSSAVGLAGFLIMGVLVWSGWQLAGFVEEWGQQFLNFCRMNYPGWEQKWWLFLGRCESFLGLPEGMLELALVERMEELLTRTGSALAERLPGGLTQLIGGSIGIFATFAVTGMASLLLYKDYDKMLEEIRRQSWYPVVSRVSACVSASGVTYLKTQGIIMTCVTLYSGLGLYLLGYRDTFFLGVLIGIVDFFPILGAGTVLIPWTLILLLQGDWLTAAGTGSIYLLCFFTRQFLEPRLMGQQSGIRPFYMLICIYLGLRLFGIWGVFLGPLGAALVRGVYVEWSG